MNKKPKPKHIFKPLGFQVSTDYNLLWKLINDGYRIPAWVGYDDFKFETVIWELVEVKLKDGRYMIGKRGLRYEGFDYTLEGLIMACKVYSLHFVLPSNLEETK
jgi:hypothetical protein